jgi:hypothetical protein
VDSGIVKHRGSSSCVRLYVPAARIQEWQNTAESYALGKGAHLCNGTVPWRSTIIGFNCARLAKFQVGSRLWLFFLEHGGAQLSQGSEITWDPRCCLCSVQERIELQ